MSSGQSLVKAGLIVSGGMALGRIAGFVRELVLASSIGVGHMADQAVLLLTIPDLIVFFLIGGASNIVLVPHFVSIKAKEEKSYFFYSVSLFFFVLCIFIFLALAFLAPYLIKLLAPGFTSQQISEIKPYFLIILASLPLVAMNTVSRAFLHSLQRFVTSSLANFNYNLVIIISLLLVSASQDLLILSIAFVLAIVFRWLPQLVEIIWSQRVFPKLKRYPVKPFLNPYFQATASGIIVSLVPLVTRSLGSIEQTGNIARFNYAFKFFELPYGVLIGVFGTILLPRFSQLAAENKSIDDLLKRSYSLVNIICLIIIGSMMTFFLTLSSMKISFYKLAGPDTRDIFILAALFLLALPFRGYSSIHLAILSSKKDTRTLFQSNMIACLLLSPLLSYFLIKLYGLYGIGLGLAASYFVVYLLEAFLISLRYDYPLWRMVASGRHILMYFFSGGLMFGAFQTALTLESEWLSLGVSALPGLVILVVSYFAFSEFRLMIKQKLRFLP